MKMKRIGKFMVRKAIRVVRAIPPVRRLMDAEAAHTLDLGPELLRGRVWQELDVMYTACRRALRSTADWRLGPGRVYEVAREGFDGVKNYLDIRGMTYCDLGCGGYHPYGTSAAMYLNGARETISLDRSGGDKRRAAEALADLLSECITCPDRWHWSSIDRTEYMRRAAQFDLAALQEGQLDEGIGSVPMRHVVTDIHSSVLKDGSVDVMTSRAVLEHFLDFGRAVEKLFALMRGGGVACHVIDLVDHRAYTGQGYHFWSFLAEEDDWSDGVVNRLRSCEIKPHFERVGFEVLRYDTKRSKMPDGFMNKVRGRFRRMSDDEISITSVHCVLRKP